MTATVFIICVTFLVVLVVYWIMPIEKMKEVNGALKSLLQVLPISQIVRSWRDNRTMEEKRTRIDVKNNGEQEINH